MMHHQQLIMSWGKFIRQIYTTMKKQIIIVMPTTTTIKENTREEMNGSNNVSEHSNDNTHTVIIPFLEDAVRNASTKVNNITLKNRKKYCSSLNFIRKDHQ